MMRVTVVTLSVFLVVCLQTASAGWSHNGKTAAGKQGGMPNPRMSPGVRRFRSFRFPQFRARTNGSAPLSSMTCMDVICPAGTNCQMTNATCNRNPCRMPLCFRAVTPIVSSAVNPGTCPMSAVDVAGGCEGSSPMLCSNDSTCAINQKCCLSGCSLQCTNVTSLVLARMRMTAAQFSPRQRGPSRQRGSSRQRGFFRQREPPFSMFCPRVPAGALKSGCEDMTCSSDDDCMGSMKCCMAGCGKICMNPRSILAVARQQSMKAAKETRAKAAAAAKTAASGNSSAPAFRSRAGVCPTIALDADVGSVSQCDSDMDCSGSMKCCVHGQGLGCFDPVMFMMLPSPLSSTRMQMQHSKGSNQDLMEMRGNCPFVDTSLGVTCGLQCSQNSNCSEEQLCCPVGPCQECTNPVISDAFMDARPGVCPEFPPDFASICQVNCTTDEDCPMAGTKCCSAGCSRMCVNPIASMSPMIKAGTCPTVSAAPPAASGAPSGGSNGPGNSLRTRGRFQPLNQQGLDPCFFRNFNVCRLDNDCPGTSKCCVNECGARRCAQPV